MLFKNRRILSGIDAITKYLGLSSTSIAVIDWYKEYDLPMQKKNGIWTADKRELNQWLREHEFLIKEEIPAIYEPVLTIQSTKGRFGFIEHKLMRGKKEIRTWKS
ncbi:MAG: hypothetical protein KKC46_13665 [Proteobacteria bacterium]|nr:hypothetical protein [Pseudomonadota bacterium]